MEESRKTAKKSKGLMAEIKSLKEDGGKHWLAKVVVLLRHVIIIAAVALVIPCAIMYINTRVNYDILSYLPKDIETMKGQDILLDEFGNGAFSLCVVEGMPDKDIVKLKEKIEEVDHVKKVVWYDSFMDISVPKEMLPDNIYDAFVNGDATMMAVIFDEGTSSDGTMEAIKEIRKISDKQVFLSGISAVVTDTKDLSEKEANIYVAIAVVLCVLVLQLTMDSFLAPVFFLLSIGMAVIYNLGTNLFLGEISYITKALAAVLQLGVTMDYSIFLWHSYLEYLESYPDDKNRAMVHAISATFSSVVGSSITTVAGFIALCFMTFTLGLDLGIVMAKGVIFGVISCVTVLPSMILVFDRPLQKSRHKPLLPDIKGIGDFVTKHYIIFALVALILLVPALYGYTHYSVYYNLDSSLPKDLPCIVANEKLDENFKMSTMEMALVSADTGSKEVRSMTREIEEIDGIKWALGVDSVIGPSIPDDLLPLAKLDSLENDEHKLLFIASEYPVASDEVNEQCNKVNDVIKKYDPTGMLIGEAPCTKDLIEITDKDFNTVSMVSIGLVFIIILAVFGSASLPFLLVAVIELAIFINMGIPCYTGTRLPFIASIVIGTIQLGSTVDYAILMTTRYKKERSLGKDKREAVSIALQSSAKSVMISALSFFAATFGVGIYSTIDMISALCVLMARGALISMCMVIFVLPSVLMIFDGIIIHTSRGFIKKKEA